MTSVTGSRVRPRLSPRRRGFTLIELLVALAIMVMIAAALPVVLGRMVPTRRVAVTADRLMADLQWLQGESIRARTVGQLSLLPDGYQMDAGASHRRVTVTDTTRIQLRARADERVLQTLMFFADGTAQPARLSVTDTGRRVDLDVSMLTGRIQRRR